jgi:hypothetical protein
MLYKATVRLNQFFPAKSYESPGQRSLSALFYMDNPMIQTIKPKVLGQAADNEEGLV